MAPDLCVLSFACVLIWNCAPWPEQNDIQRCRVRVSNQCGDGKWATRHAGCRLEGGNLKKIPSFRHSRDSLLGLSTSFFSFISIVDVDRENSYDSDILRVEKGLKSRLTTGFLSMQSLVHLALGVWHSVSMDVCNFFIHTICHSRTQICP